MSFMWSALSMPMQNRLSRFTPNFCFQRGFGNEVINPSIPKSEKSNFDLLSIQKKIVKKEKIVDIKSVVALNDT
jgi:hypothetical protein